MTSSDMWKQLVERHPVLSTPDGVIKLRASGLRNLIEQAYNEGRASRPPTANPFSRIIRKAQNVEPP